MRICRAILLSFLACAAISAEPVGVTCMVDPVKGNDANPAGKAWRTYAKLNTVRLAPGDTVVIAPGRQEECLIPRTATALDGRKVRLDYAAGGSIQIRMDPTCTGTKVENNDRKKALP